MIALRQFCLLGSVVLACACGSSDEDEGGTTGGNNNPNLNIDLNLNTGNGQPGTGNYQGGVVSLSSGQLSEIEGAACAGWSAEPEPLPSRLMMVIDVSSSMNQTTAATGGQTKWEVTRAALLDAVRGLPGSTSVGMLLYPNMQTTTHDQPANTSDCVAVDELLPFDVLGGDTSPHRQLVNQTLQQAKLNRSTPTHDAYATALQSVLTAPAASVKTFMLLITDGEPTLSRGCVGDENLTPRETQPIVDEIMAARGQGIDTFIIGSPGSEVTVTGADARPWLSRAAETGNTSQGNCSHSGEPYCHFDMTTADDFSSALRGALASIAGQVVQCTYSFPQPPPGETINGNAINVVYKPTGADTQLVLRDSDPNCDQGWYLSEGQVTLCEQTCSAVLADPNATLEVHFGCQTFEGPPE